MISTTLRKYIYLEMIKMKKFVSIALVLVMMLAMAVSVAAETSPTAAPYYDITVKTDGKGDATTDKNKIEVKQDGDKVTLTAIDGDETFVNWTIDGDYTIVEGDTSTRVIVIQPTSDITATAHFKGQDATEVVKPTTKPNEGGTSPKTGDPTMMIIALVLLAAGLGVVAVKKIKA